MGAFTTAASRAFRSKAVQEALIFSPEATQDWKRESESTLVKKSSKLTFFGSSSTLCLHPWDAPRWCRWLQGFKNLCGSEIDCCKRSTTGPFPTQQSGRQFNYKAGSHNISALQASNIPKSSAAHFLSFIRLSLIGSLGDPSLPPPLLGFDAKEGLWCFFEGFPRHISMANLACSGHASIAEPSSLIVVSREAKPEQKQLCHPTRRNEARAAGE